MPTYNVAPFVARAIASVVQQTFPDWELIVVDDCSSDLTIEAVSRFARNDSRIRLKSTPVNSGPGAARNLALAAARGDWIAVLDGDDAWQPSRLEKLLHCAEQTRADFVADNLLQYDMALGAVIGPAGKFKESILPIHLRSFFENKARGRPLGYGLLKPIIKRRFLERHGLGYRDDLRFGEDFRFYVDIFAAGAQGVLISDAYYIYTMPHGPRSGQRSSASRTDRNESITLSIMDDIIATYADHVPIDVRDSILACRQRVEDNLTLARFRVSRPGLGRLGKAALLATRPQVAMARVRQLVRSATDAAK